MVYSVAKVHNFYCSLNTNLSVLSGTESVLNKSCLVVTEHYYSQGFIRRARGGFPTLSQSFPAPQKFEKYDVIIASTATIGSIIV